jgi:maleate isomerase
MTYRIGLIVPSSNTTMETEIPAMLRRHAAADEFSFHSSRMRMQHVTPKELAAMDDQATRCAGELAGARCDAVAYACLVAIMSRGRRYHEQAESTISAELAAEGGPAPVVSSAGALVAARQRMQACRIAIITPYLKPLTAMVADYIEDGGVEVCRSVSLEVADNFAVGRLDPQDLLGVAGGLDLDGSIALTVEWAPQRRRNFYNALMLSGFPVGGILAAGAAIALLHDHGFRTLFAFGGLPLVTVVPVAALLLPESPSFEAARAERRARARARQPRASVLDVFRGRNAVAAGLFALANFCGFLLVYGLNTWLPQLMRSAGYELGSALAFLLGVPVVIAEKPTVSGVGTKDRYRYVNERSGRLSGASSGGGVELGGEAGEGRVGWGEVALERPVGGVGHPHGVPQTALSLPRRSGVTSDRVWNAFLGRFAIRVSARRVVDALGSAVILLRGSVRTRRARIAEFVAARERGRSRSRALVALKMGRADAVGDRRPAPPAEGASTSCAAPS